MDKIFLKNCEFYGFHGVLPEETALGQRFVISLILEMDTRISGKSDEVSDTVSYADVFDTMRVIVEEECYKLLETLTDRLAMVILEQYPLIEFVTVTAEKPRPPINGHFESVAVEIKRSRKDIE